jgi:CheY-like chemotaxis protein
MNLAAPMEANVLHGRILVVEDEPDIRELLGETLAVLGDVELAVDGQDALERIERGGAPAVMLLDLCLPRLSGPELLERLRGAGFAVPVVTMTASHHAPPRGVAEHLRKPFPIERAVDALLRAAAAVAMSGREASAAA